MGIPGLTTYVNNQSDIFYKDHALHDTVLLIDGNSLSSQIYVNITVTNSAFGGDYERYEHCVHNFMKFILSCNILPIVVFDGGYESRKLKTTVSRLRNTIRGVSCFKSINQQNNVKLFPIFMKEVFKDVLSKLHIPCVQSDLEADFDLVYLSRKFKCPVLSYDSDFYLNDVQYIPFFYIQMKGGRECEASSTGKAIPCQIYKVEHLLQHFGGMSKEFLPLLQCMLGNDYISHIHFKSFLSEVNFRYSSNRKSPVSKRLAVLIKWCKCQKSLETAVVKIVENLKINKKTEAVKLLKRSIVEYQTEESLLYPYVMEQIEMYKLNGKLEQLENLNKRECGSSNGNENGESYVESIQDDLTGEEIEDNDDVGGTDKDNTDTEDGTNDEVSCTEDEEGESAMITENSAQFKCHYLKIPWLVNEFRHGHLSNHIANIINLRSIFLLPLRENIKLDSAHKISYHLLKVIGNLLLSGIHKEAFLRVYTRSGARMKIVRLKCDESIGMEENEARCNILSIPECDLTSRRQLLLRYLNLSFLEETLFNGDLFPEEWNLFVLSLVYWCRTSPHVNSYHVKSLILSFIYLNILQTHCGFFSSTSAFNKKYFKKLSVLRTEIQTEKVERKKIRNAEKKRKSKLGKENISSESTKENLSKDEDPTLSKTNSKNNVLKFVENKIINEDKLILLYDQWFPLSHLNESLKSNHTFFGKEIIHTFCEYQSLFYFISMLNSIMKFPFQELDMSRIYSGTFLYNVYSQIFSKDTRIRALFEQSNEMFEVYSILLKFVEEKTDNDVFNVIVKKGRRKKKKKEKGDNELEEEEEQVDTNGDGIEGDEDVLIDSDNIYSILQKVHI